MRAQQALEVARLHPCGGEKETERRGGGGGKLEGAPRSRAPSPGRGEGPQARPGLGPGRAPPPPPLFTPSSCPGLSSTPRRRSPRAALRMRHANCATTPFAHPQQPRLHANGVNRFPEYFFFPVLPSRQAPPRN